MSEAEILQLLRHGTLEIEGFLPWSSNHTFLARVCNSDKELFAVYKPRQGERPLWDFTQGTLCWREQAAFIVSDALGWDLVPPTVMREGPHGLGSLQLFVEHNPEDHYFTIEGEEVYQRQLQQIALLDIVINNADRKGGHILIEETTNSSNINRLWAIDHGVCFHSSYKLRTVIWDFAGMDIPENLLLELINLRQQFNMNSSYFQNQLNELLTIQEISSLKNRLERLIEKGKFWEPGPGRHYPWPPV